jgi:branched-subunit amino acid ABC-type transport system permease component
VAVITSTLVVELTLVGIAFGALYSLAALGIVLIYTTIGVLNFAHGAIGIKVSAASSGVTISDNDLVFVPVQPQSSATTICCSSSLRA